MAEFWSPKYLQDCFEVLDQQSDSMVVCAGMTHLLRFYEDFPMSKTSQPEGVLYVGQIQSLAETREETGKFSIGSTCTVSDLEVNDYLMRHCPAVWEAALQTSTPQIRNMRTLGGELAWGSFHSPLIASLLAYDAEIRVRRVATEGGIPHEETIDLLDFYQGPLVRNNGRGNQLECRKADLGPRDLIIKASVSEQTYRRPGSFSFFKSLQPKISTENPGLVVAVRGIAQANALARAQFVVAGPWIETIRVEIPLEGVKLRPNIFFEKLYQFCDRFPFEKHRRSGPSGPQLGLMTFGLMKEGFSAFMGI